MSSFKDDLDKIADKQDRIAENMADMAVDIAKIELTLERNTEALEEHMRRTALNEERLSILESDKDFLKGAAWVIGGLIAAGFTAVIAFFK